MNLGLLFFPVYRASTTAFLLGLALFAMIDWARLSFGIPGLPGWLPVLAIWFFVFSLFANRRRHAQRAVSMSIFPVITAILFKGMGAVLGGFPAFGVFATEFFEASGVDPTDQVQVQEISNDPAFQRALMEALFGDGGAWGDIAAASAWPSFIGFWSVVLLFAIVFAGMKKTGGSIGRSAS
jgi:hypothetical protein